MPNLKHIKDRIKSIKSTEKITRAMKLVAASKVRKAQVRVLNSRPYTKEIVNFVHKTFSALEESDRSPLMQQRKIKSAGLIVISSDRGLCGSYNTNVIKNTVKRILELEKEGLKIRLITIGNKANNFFKRTKVEIAESFTQLPAVPTIELANLIASSAEDLFVNNSVDKVEIIGTDFISMLRNEIYIKQFLPISKKLADSEISSHGSGFILFEPSLSSVLDNLIPLYLSNVIYHALLEASCSELASRMNAMSNATNNAKELINGLTIIYNKARQASITQELTEIVGGMEALK